MIIKAIIFDLGGVVINLDFSNFINKIISQSPLSKPQTPTMLEFFKQSDTYHQGKMSNAEFYHLACDIFQVCALDQAGFFTAFNSIISGFNPKITELIKDLHKTGQYKLIALSNINSSHWKYLSGKNWGFIEYFDELVLSHEIQLIKPQPKIFEYVIQKAGCEPKEIVFIDDGLNNIRSAKNFGIKGINYTTFKDLIVELQKLEIL